MAESEKTAAPSVKSKGKNSMLDMDMDKDLFGSWKSADDGMDFDFGPPTSTGSKKTAFKFDKMDMDFSFEADFGKSFKLDMPGFDLSSQESEKSKEKSTEKSKEKSKEKPSGGEQRAKKDSFKFDFDFNEFGNLDFESKKTKVDGKSNKSKDKEECLNLSGSDGSGDLFTKNFNSSQDSDTSKPPASRGPSDLDGKSNKSKDKEECSNVSGSEGSGDLFTKNFDTSQDSDISKPPASRGPSDLEVDIQTDHDKESDPRNEENNMKFATDESCHLKPANAEEHEIQTSLSSEKIISSSLQGPIQESQSPERRSPPKHHAQPVAQDVYGHAVADNVSTDETFSDVQEEEASTMDRMASPSSGDAPNENARPVAQALPTRSLSVENSSARMNVQSQKSEMSEISDDNPVIGHIDGDAARKADSHPENSETPGIENSALGETVKRIADSFSKPHLDSLDGGNKIDKLVSEKERGSIPIRSKYFKKQDGTDSELQQAPVSSTKLISVGNKRMNTLPNTPALEKRSEESGSKFTAISRPLSKVLSRDISKQAEFTERGQIKGHETTREGLNANNTKPRNELMKTTVAHDTGPTMKESVSKGNDQSSEHINAIRSDVHAANSIEQAKKIILPQISLNTGLPATNMTSNRNVRKIAVEKNRIPPTTVQMKKSEVSSLRVSRVTDPKLKPLSFLLPNNLTMRNKEQGTDLQANLLQRNPSVDKENQTPSPTSLKRKSSEESAAIRRLAPLKRLSASPSISVRASPQKVVEEQVCDHASVAHDKSPRINAPQTEMDISMAHVKSPRFDASQIEMDISSSLDDDSIAEKAEACSKELEDICNMLKEKHEEAKDLLLRAIVNNNNIAILNHPVFQDKIRMVQKFAELLISK